MATCVLVEVPKPPVEYLLRLNAREASYVLRTLEPRLERMKAGDGVLAAGIQQALIGAGAEP